MFTTRIHATSHRTFIRVLLKVRPAKRRDTIIGLARFTGLSKDELEEYTQIMLKEVKDLESKMPKKLRAPKKKK